METRLLNMFTRICANVLCRKVALCEGYHFIFKMCGYENYNFNKCAVVVFVQYIYYRTIIRCIVNSRGIARNFVTPGPSTHDMISIGSLLLSKSHTAGTGTAEETLSRGIGLS